MTGNLAIHGGPRTIPDGLIQPWPHVTASDREAIAEVLASEKITEQQRIQSEGLAKEWVSCSGVKSHQIYTNVVKSNHIYTM